MPTISRFFGIRILMYHADHSPPHFHVRYGDSLAALSIESLDVVAGRLPRRVQALVLEWAMMHRPDLRQNWHRAERLEPLVSIPGLDEEV